MENKKFSFLQENRNFIQVFWKHIVQADINFVAIIFPKNFKHKYIQNKFFYLSITS